MFLILRWKSLKLIIMLSIEVSTLVRSIIDVVMDECVPEQDEVMMTWLYREQVGVP
jgi:hypothetical protein